MRQYLVGQSLGVKMTSWYEWSGNEGFALVRPGGNTPNPAYNACKVMIAQLTGYRLDRRVPAAGGRDFVLRYVNGKGGVKLVCWTGPVAVADLFGAASTLPVQTGKIEVPLTGAPQYATLHP